MDKMAEAIAAALRVLNPKGQEPTAPDPLKHRDNCDKPHDKCDNFPPRAT